MQAITVLIFVAPLVLIIVIVVGGTVVGRRMGYSVGGEIVVRCREGHLFTTTWIPGVSLKAVRIGWVRLQYCPVGRHWTFVTPVRDADLTDEERLIAAQYHDTWMP